MKSPTETLVSEIEVLTGMIFGPEQRKEIAERIRKYRFHQVSHALLKLKELAQGSGNPALSEKIFSSLEPDRKERPT